MNSGSPAAAKKKALPATVSFTFDEFTDMEFEPPAKFFIMTAMQEYVFVRTRSRALAQETVDSIYGVGKYKVKASSISDS
jgi:hypothetical protein